MTSPVTEFSDDGEVVLGGTHATVEEALLDPKVWQAAGKTRGWTQSIRCGACTTILNQGLYRGGISGRIYFLHRFIDNLADGKTIDEALAAISQGV